MVYLPWIELNWNNLFSNQKVYNQNVSIYNTSEYIKVIYSYEKSDQGKNDNFITATADLFSLVSKLKDEELEVKKIRLNNL